MNLNRPKVYDRRGTSRSPRGVAIWLMAVIISFLFLLTGYAINLSLHFAWQADLDNVTRAASLAAATILDGTEEKWRNSKLNILRVIKDHKLSSLGDTGRLSFAPPCDTSGPEDPIVPANSPFRCSVASNDNLLVKVERGVYWPSADQAEQGRYEFTSLEGKGRYLGVPVPAITNAVRVTIERKILPIFGRMAVSTLSSSGISIIDDQRGACVFPFAIPACELFPDTQDATDYTADEYIENKQCGRELTFTQAERNDPMIREGLWRADAVPRPAYLEQRSDPPLYLPDNKALPIKGVIGSFSSDFAESELSPEDAGKALDDTFSRAPDLNGSSSTCSGLGYAPLGARFLPLVNYGTNSDILGNVELEENFAKWLNNSTQTFAHHFFYEEEGVWKPRPNFPALRGLRPDPLTFDRANDFPECPGQDGDPHALIDLYYGPFVLGTGIPPARLFPLGNLIPRTAPDDPWQDDFSADPALAWTSPLCHNEFLPRTATTSQSAASSVDAAKITVMLIAPGIDGMSYCDFKNLLDDNAEGIPDIRFPTPDTEPRVVGYAEVVMVDSGTKNLEEAYGATPPGDRNPMNVLPMPDNDESCSYTEKLSADSGFHQLYQFPKAEAGGYNIFEETDSSFLSRVTRALNLPDPEDPEAPICAPEYPIEWPGYTDKDKGMAYAYPWKKVTAHCLPIPAEDCPGPGCKCTRFASPECWERRNLSAQYGCAGFRARLDCPSATYPQQAPGDENSRYFPMRKRYDRIYISEPRYAEN